MLSRWQFSLVAGSVALACLMISASAIAHPGPAGGLDVDTLLTLRDEVRQIGHDNDPDAQSEDRPRLDEIQTLVIDPGHGGDNSGATGVAGVPEKHLTLDLAYALRDRLQHKYPDLRVVMTRYDDESVGLSERTHRANLAGADLMLSLHYNAAPHDRAVGFETYFLDAQQAAPGQDTTRGVPLATAEGTVTGIDEPIEGVGPVGQAGATVELIRRDLMRAHRHDLSGALAETVQDRFVDRIDSENRGVKQGNFTILQGTHMPAVVVEAGFLTHPEEGREVLSRAHRSSVVDALVEAVEQFDDDYGHVLEPVDADSTADRLEEQLGRIGD